MPGKTQKRKIWLWPQILPQRMPERPLLANLTIYWVTADMEEGRTLHNVFAETLSSCSSLHLQSNVVPVLFPCEHLVGLRPTVASASMGSRQDCDPPLRGAGGHENYCDLASKSPRGVWVCLFYLAFHWES
jgi:hypothetical protein